MTGTGLRMWALGIGLLWAPGLVAQTALQDPTRPLVWASPEGRNNGQSPLPPGLGSTAHKPLNPAGPLLAPGPTAALAPTGHVAVLMLHPEQPFALLDGQVLRPGQRLGDWRVTGISEHGLALRRDGRTQILSPTPALVKTMRPPPLPAHKPAPPPRRSP